MRLFVYARIMKTITLDNLAYTQLKAWKRNSSESFSAVVKPVLPERGSLGAFMSFVERKRTPQLSSNEILEQTVEERSSEQHDSWI